jgi:ferrous iron transport protein A
MLAWGGGKTPEKGNRRNGGCVMMPLAMATPGEPVTIKKIGGKPEVRQHLAELGFVVDEKVTVVNESGGNVILQVKDSRIALGKAMAMKIMF